MAKPKVALYWAASCGGCEISILDIGAKILDLAAATEIVFWPSAYNGGFPLKVYAFLHQYRIVSATRDDARIIDITGHALAETDEDTALATCEVDLEKQRFSTDFNASQIDAVKDKPSNFKDAGFTLITLQLPTVLGSNRYPLTLHNQRLYLIVL